MKVHARFVATVGAPLVIAAAGHVVLADYVSGVSALNPVINYHLDDVSSGTATNSGTGGSAYNGTYHGATSTAGVYGSAASFSGGTYLSASEAGLPTGSSSRSVLFFINSTQDPGNTYPGLFTYGDYSGTNIFAVLLPSNTDTNFNGAVTGELGESNYGDGIAGTSRISDGATHFIAVTETQNLDSSNNPDGTATFHLYVDGTDQTPNGVTKTVNTTTTTTNTQTPTELDIGTSHFGNFDGTLDEVAFFNGALTSSQIQTLENDVPEPASVGALMVSGIAMLSRRRRA